MADAPARFSKFRIPSLPRVLHRERLLQRLVQNQDKPLWLINGQAAQGKTTLAASWAAQAPQLTAWLNLGPEDAPLENLIWSLARSLSVALGQDMEHLALAAGLGAQPVGHPAQLAYIAGNFFEHAPPGTQLVLDGLDQMPSQSPSLGLVQALLQALPGDRRLILLSRNQLPGQAQLILERQALVVDNQELACTPPEASELLALMSGRAPTDHQTRLAHQLTDGWVGGLVLCSESMQGPAGLDDLQYLERGSLGKVSDELFRFFAQAIFQRQSQALRDFLISCAPFATLYPEVMARLTGQPEAQEIMENLCQRHMFISRMVDDNQGPVYRLHQLFRLFLRQRYQEQRSGPGHRDFMARAGEVLADEGYLEEALNCLLEAGQHESAAGALKELAPRLLEEGRLTDLGLWLDRLPPHLVDQDPWLLYFRCQTWRWTQISQVQSALSSLREAFDRQGDPAGRLAVRALALDNSFAVALPWSRLEARLQEAESLLAELPPEVAPAQRAELLAMYGFVHAVRGSPRKAAWACEQASSLAPTWQNPFLAGRVMLCHVDALNFMGHLRQAHQKLAMMKSLAAQSPFKQPPPEAFIPSCYVRILQGDLDQARRDLDQAQAAIERAGLIYMLPVRLLYDILWCSLAGQYERARDCCAQVQALPPEMAPPFLSVAAKVLLCFGLFRQGAYQEAWDLVSLVSQELFGDACRAPSHGASGLVLKALVGRKLGKDLDLLWAEASQGRDTLLEIGSRQLQAESELALALLARDREDLAGAGQWLEAGLAGFQQDEFGPFTIIPRPQEVAELLALAAELGQPQGVEYFAAAILDQKLAPVDGLLAGLADHPHRAVKELALSLRRQARRRDAPRVEITTLGGFKARVGERTISDRQWGRKQVRQLLMALVALGPEGVSRERLMELLWPDSPPQSAEKSFKVTLHRLRKALEPELDAALGSSYLVQEGTQLRLDPKLCRLDVEGFLDLARQGERAAAEGREDLALETWQQAAELYQGDFLAGQPDVTWSRERRQLLRERLGGLLIRLAQGLEKQGRIAQAMRTYQRLIQADPCAEYAYQRLMSLQAELGLLAEAMRTYQACRQALKEGLDIEPGGNTTDIYQQIKARSQKQ